MKKLISVMISALMLCVIFTGCGGQNANADSTDAEAAAVSAGSAPGDFYAAYYNTKSVMLVSLNDGLNSNPGTSVAAASVYDVIMTELAMLPATFFGLGEAAAASSLVLLGA
ncbi:MAG: hypothetical protein PHO15_02455, partial [Eubacteriales bacterium]|nr:hypothetical protein [Eubacteriales bacterium]